MDTFTNRVKRYLFEERSNGHKSVRVSRCSTVLYLNPIQNSKSSIYMYLYRFTSMSICHGKKKPNKILEKYVFLSPKVIPLLEVGHKSVNEHETRLGFPTVLWHGVKVECPLS